MTNSFNLDFEFELSQFVLKTPQPPVAKLKWEKQKTLWKVASEKCKQARYSELRKTKEFLILCTYTAPISRSKVLTISRHKFSTPRKDPDAFLPILPTKFGPKGKPAPKDIDDEGHDVDDDGQADANHGSTTDEGHNNHHTTAKKDLSHLKYFPESSALAFSASCAAYASSLPASYRPVHLRTIHAEVFDRLAQPKRISPPQPPSEMEIYRQKEEGRKVTQELFERLHKEGQEREMARIKQLRAEEAAREADVHKIRKHRHHPKKENAGGEGDPPAAEEEEQQHSKEFFDRLAVPKNLRTHHCHHEIVGPGGAELKQYMEQQKKKKKPHPITQKDLERLATPRYKVVLIGHEHKKKDPGLKELLEEGGDGEYQQEKDAEKEGGNETAVDAGDHDAPVETVLNAVRESRAGSASGNRGADTMLEKTGSATNLSSEALSNSSGSRPISRKEPLPAIPPGSRGSIKREEAAVADDLGTKSEERTEGHQEIPAEQVTEAFAGDQGNSQSEQHQVHDVTDDTNTAVEKDSAESTNASEHIMPEESHGHKTAEEEPTTPAATASHDEHPTGAEDADGYADDFHNEHAADVTEHPVDAAVSAEEAKPQAVEEQGHEPSHAAAEPSEPEPSAAEAETSAPHHTQQPESESAAPADQEAHNYEDDFHESQNDHTADAAAAIEPSAESDAEATHQYSEGAAHDSAAHEQSDNAVPDASQIDKAESDDPDQTSGDTSAEKSQEPDIGTTEQNQIESTNDDPAAEAAAPEPAVFEPAPAEEHPASQQDSNDMPAQDHGSGENAANLIPDEMTAGEAGEAKVEGAEKLQEEIVA
ncbi:hypothetical protein HDU96_004039 [Phlyctochytrium bullatum]|nr:hypothetical protein HDU96_004039 [Phlyctochytrium bullatum]